MLIRLLIIINLKTQREWRKFKNLNLKFKNLKLKFKCIKLRIKINHRITSSLIKCIIVSVISIIRIIRIIRIIIIIIIIIKLNIIIIKIKYICSFARIRFIIINKWSSILIIIITTKTAIIY